MACQHSHCDQITHLSNNNTRAVIITDPEQTRSQWIREWGQGVDRIEGNGTGTDSGSSFSLVEDMRETSGGHAGNLSSNVSNCGEPSGKQHGQLALITGLTRLAQSSFISTLPSPSPTQCISLLMSGWSHIYTHTWIRMLLSLSVTSQKTILSLWGFSFMDRDFVADTSDVTGYKMNAQIIWFWKNMRVLIAVSDFWLQTFGSWQIWAEFVWNTRNIVEISSNRDHNICQRSIVW